MKHLVYSLVLFIYSTVSAETMVDINLIANKDMEAVQAFIGEADSCKPSKYGQKCDYNHGDIEILFIDQKADWITINSLEGLPFNDDSITLLGIPGIPPTVNNKFDKHWEQVPGLISVTIFGGSNGISYAYIKVSSE